MNAVGALREAAQRLRVRGEAQLAALAAVAARAVELAAERFSREEEHKVAFLAALVNAYAYGRKPNLAGVALDRVMGVVKNAAKRSVTSE